MQFDKADRDPARFWGHVVAALSGVVPSIEAAAGPAVPSSGADAGPLLERITSELTAAGPVVLVIDDYHLIASPAVDDAVERLVELAPSSFLLILSTRLDPPLRLSRLRVRSQLVEIRGDTLRFAPAEHACFCTTSASPTLRRPPCVNGLRDGPRAGTRRALPQRQRQPAAFVEAFQGDDRLSSTT